MIDTNNTKVDNDTIMNILLNTIQNRIQTNPKFRHEISTIMQGYFIDNAEFERRIESIVSEEIESNIENGIESYMDYTFNLYNHIDSSDVFELIEYELEKFIDEKIEETTQERDNIDKVLLLEKDNIDLHNIINTLKADIEQRKDISDIQYERLNAQSDTIESLNKRLLMLERGIKATKKLFVMIYKALNR